MQKCSFCQKVLKGHEKLFSGPDVLICEDCVKFCHETLTRTDTVSVKNSKDAKDTKQPDKTAERLATGTPASSLPFFTVEDCQFVNPLRSQTIKLKECYGKERAKMIEHKTLKDLYDILTADPRTRDWCEGDDLIELAHQLLDCFRQERSADQVGIHDAIMTACEPQIYAKDFDEKRIEILKRQQRSAFVMSALIMTPRRWGKTMAGTVKALRAPLRTPARGMFLIETYMVVCSFHGHGGVASSLSQGDDCYLCHFTR